MAVLQDININVHGQPSEKRLQTFLRLSQNENGRMINFRVLGPPLPSGCTATFSGTKPDGNVYSKTGTVAGNFVVIQEDMQMTAVAGVWDAKLDIINGSHNIMTALIRVVVDADVVDPDAIASDSQLQGLVAEAKYYAEHARTDAYGSPLTAALKAEMTDKTRVYVYTGSETGMTAGNWYYWNGSAWTSGGVYNAVAVQTDKTLTVQDKAADGKAAGDAIEELKEELNKYNAYDVLTGQLSRTSGTHNGITFTWSGDVCDVDGTSTNTAVNIIRSATTLPPEIIPGQDCYVKYSTTDSNVQLRIIFRDSSDVNLQTLLLAKDTSITVPAGATKYTIALYVASGKTINHATISVTALLSAMSNMDLWKGSLINCGALPNGTDLDNVTQPGFYTLVEGRTYPNSIGGSIARLLEVFNTATYVYQSITVLTNERVYRRFYSQSAGWHDWDKGTIYSEKFISKGVLPDGTDLDDVTEEGHYLITNSYTYANTPYETPATYPSTLEVLHTTDNTILQRVIDGQRKKAYIRQTVLGVFPTTWSEVNDFVKRKMVYNDLDEDTYIAFRVAMYVRQQSFEGYRSYLLPVKKGNTIRLRTAAKYPIGTYAIAKSNYLVTYKHPYAEDQTAVTYVDDTFDVTADGFIAINCLDGYYRYFLCEVDYGSASDNIRNNLFVNALKNPYNFIPEYDDSNPTKVLKKGPSLMGAIHHWGLIGASYDSGELNYTKPGATEAQRSSLDYYEYSWMSELARANGIKDLYHYSNGGQNSKQWITLTGNPQIDGTGRGYFYSTGEFEVALSRSGGLSETAGIGPGGGCWWKLKADYAAGKAKQAYVIVLGSNDINNNNPHDSAWNELADGSYDATLYYKAGSIEDIGTYDLATDTDTVPSGKTAGVVPGIVNSYAAYIGAILNRIIAQQPDCVIFLATIRNNFAWNENSLAIWNGYNDVLRQIAQMERFRGNVLLIDFAEYGPNYMQKDLYDCLVGMHPNAIGYHEIAYYYGTLIDYAIRKNFKMLAQSAFIGTNFIYRYDS